LIKIQKFFLSILLLLALSVWSNAQTFNFETNEAKQRIDILIDRKLFTSYRWEARIRRPVLLPIMTADGNFVTRGFPIETRNGETINHPHQVGSAFVYGDVNGIDFWNNSPFRTEKELERMGQIVHRKVLKQQAGKGKAELITQSHWIMPDEKTILFETTKFTFQADGKNRIIERQTTLTANGENVTFGDNKEGLFMIHLRRELQQNNQFPVKITDEKGNISEAATNKNLTGEYLNSNNLVGEQIWGTLGKWAGTTGKINDENVTVAIFDHPKNINYPSYMMVRPYGLLALNPFGKKAFEPNAEPRKFVLEKGKSITFRHQLMIYSEKTDSAKIEKDFLKFSK
jgi:Methane oxygenase PmoA